MKKILIIVLTLFSVFLITYYFKDNSKQILILSKQEVAPNTFGYYIIDYLKENGDLKNQYIYDNPDLTALEISNIIKDNTSINDKKIQNLLVKVDYILVQIEGSANVESLIKTLRKYCKEKIIFITNSDLNILSDYNIKIINYEQLDLQTNKKIANQIIHNML